MTTASPSRPGSRSRASLWLAAPLLALLAAIVMVVMLPRAPAAGEAPRAAPAPAPYVGSDPSLPAELSTTAEPQPHVQAF